jgi:hypothetical protein
MSAQTFDQRQHGTPTAPLAGDAAPATEDEDTEDMVTESMGEETETR